MSPSEPRSRRSFAETVTAAPAVSRAEAARVARERFGCTDATVGAVRALGSQHDANFVLEPEPGGAGERMLLKFANPVTTAEELVAQSLAAERLGRAEPGILVPRTIPGADGELVQQVDVGGTPMLVRALSFVEGTPLSGPQTIDAATAATLGALAARSVRALAGFEHPGIERDLEWDLRNAGRLVTELLPFVGDAGLAARIRSAGRAAQDALAALEEEELPLQAVHGDLTDDNVVGRRTAAGRLDPVGIIDFGDVMRSWAVAELAVTCSSLQHHHRARPASILPAVRAFHSLRPLSGAEAEVLWPLVVARAATLVVSAHHAAAIDPANDYTRENAEHEHRVFDVATSVPLAVMTRLVLDATGHAARARAATAHAATTADAARAADAAGAAGSAKAGGSAAGGARAGGSAAGSARAGGSAAGRATPDAPTGPRITPPTATHALLAVPLATPGAGAATAGAGRPDAHGIVTLDLSSTSRALDDGRFTHPDVEALLAAEALAAGAAVVLTRFGERRLTRSFRESREAHPCVALGVELWTASSTPVLAPWPGTLRRDGDRLLLIGAESTLELTGVEPSTPAAAAVPAGAALGHTTAGQRLGVRLLAAGTDPAAVPWFATAELAPGWRSIALDPTPLIAAPSTAPETPASRTTAAVASERGGRESVAAPSSDAGVSEGTDALLARRERSLAEVQEHYYAHPPRIERGWRHNLFDTEARPYLDMVNNVAAVGHAHPRIADAVDRQLRLFNSNSRFNYEAIVELSERLTVLLPDPLDTVFLVNSGTEAVDLALRISWAWSKRRDVVAVREAYHGWSDASDAVSTSVADNPNALETRPEWVHTLDAPNAYRGRHRGDEARHYAPEAVAEIERLAAAGRPPATFIAEAFYGNAGGMPLPDGYLPAVYEAVRAHGGLCIADEVQVGYGRLGDVFWGFELQGVVPDIVTIAKAMGNGHPLGAVVTRREVADEYRSQGYFFSSAGGSPVSSVVGLTVLDILADEGLQQNAREVGAHLKRRLEELGERHPLIGAVHGRGLYLGVELVRDRETREPATEETAALCERMLELGVIVQPTSDRQCVLKIKPPMTLTIASADFFADTLDEVLTFGW
ncbi:aminotransferase class III-fold pyridoxal phosphate-dependent enzyme [Herbiconiux sp. 11R-BC]|uniref:aminotransferase class III-fold pyridoxal phosphate-dependent enzyme n=1 Tax=Herbiconiux sp. 11R-BC TaxID=3111637 RepID=UPI003C099F66